MMRLRAGPMLAAMALAGLALPQAAPAIAFIGDPETTKRLTVLTDNFTLRALAIPHLYKSRWQLELSIESST